MAKKSLRNVSGKLLNSTEHKALSKLLQIHKPMLAEMEKWKEHREKLETTLLDRLDTIGKILEPYYEQSRETLVKMAGQIPSARYSNKKTSSSSSKKTSSRRKSGTKKSRR